MLVGGAVFSFWAGGKKKSLDTWDRKLRAQDYLDDKSNLTNWYTHAGTWEKIHLYRCVTQGARET